MAHKGLALRRAGSNDPSFYPDFTSTRAASPAPVWLRGLLKCRRQRLTARTRIAAAGSWSR